MKVAQQIECGASQFQGHLLNKNNMEYIQNVIQKTFNMNSKEQVYIYILNITEQIITTYYKVNV